MSFDHRYLWNTRFVVALFAFDAALWAVHEPGRNWKQSGEDFMADPDTPPSPMPEWLAQELTRADVAARAVSWSRPPAKAAAARANGAKGGRPRKTATG